MTSSEASNGKWHRKTKTRQQESKSDQAKSHENMQEDLVEWEKYMKKVKGKVLEQVQDHLRDILDKALTESIEPPAHLKSALNGKTTTKESSRSQRKDDGKVFLERASLLELVLEFDLLFYAFGKLGTVTWAWLAMFIYTLVVPYFILEFWGSLYHKFPSKLGLTLGAGLIFTTIQTCVLGLFPIYTVVHHQLPPASRFIVILEQIRFLMKTYSFIRETAPVILKNTPKEGENPRFPTFSSYLYFLFCPTLIYREFYPRNRQIRWKYVAVTLGKIFGCLFYGYFILVRLCIPVFRPETNQPFSKRTMVLAVFHSILPGIMLLLLCFFAFLHCWLNLFGELLRFADRMFYKDWWNSTSFANYYRTWNVVVHDWLYYYGYRDFLWLSNRRFRAAAMLSVFIVSAVVHEYALAMGFGFFYPVMFCLFAVFGVAFNFTMTDKRQSPVFNVIMWACLFLGQGVQVCLYCQEWYAQIHCPPAGDSLWELVMPRSWSCRYHK
uniref:Sterol O-acyltransferase 2 n=1 Tax=Xiphophorus maculatus TaxID=8083 RepID=A0A3B5PZE3_XIPMA